MYLCAEVPADGVGVVTGVVPVSWPSSVTATPQPSGATGTGRHRRWALVVVFALVGGAVALVRFRVSPVYPTDNDVNSDFYVFQVVGNSWAHGKWPYEDVFDVKGPSLLLLFRFFAAVQGWSVWPPLLMLVALANAALWIAYATARRWVGPASAAACSVAVILLVYLSPGGIPTSFSCEELAVPGVLLLLWLTCRWASGERVSGWWWIADGAVLGFLFWAKYQVVAPWAAVLIALALFGARVNVSRAELLRVVVTHLVGFAALTVFVLGWYVPVLPRLGFAYFRASSPEQPLAREPWNQADFVGELIGLSPWSMLALLAVVLVFALAAARESGLGLVMGVASLLAGWASVAVVRHPTNVVVPLCFLAVAVPMLVAWIGASDRVRAARVAAGLLIVAAVATVPALQESRTRFGLFHDDPPTGTTCYTLPSRTPIRGVHNVSALFARTAGTGQILSVGTLFAARPLAITHTVPDHPFEYSYVTWGARSGAQDQQTAYLRERTFGYVWVAARDLDLRAPIGPQLIGMASTDGPTTPVQAELLSTGYTPALACRGQLLMKAGPAPR